MASVYRTWADGDAFTAADAGTYFMRQVKIVCDTQTDRDAILAPTEGLTVWRKDTDAVEIYDGTDWLTFDTKWQDYTPTLSNMTKGNGTIVAKYFRTGKHCHVRFRFTLGTTSAIGTYPSFTMPFSAYDGSTAAQGSGNAVDTGNYVYPIIVGNSVTAISPSVALASSTYLLGSAITATTPFTWGNADYMQINWNYQTV